MNQLQSFLDNLHYYANNNPSVWGNQVGAFLTPKRGYFPRYYYDNMSNDIRHAYASAVLARDKGQKTAKNLGELNEWFDYSSSGRNDTPQDLKANEWGINYALKYPNYTNEQYLQKLYQDYINTHSY